MGQQQLLLLVLGVIIVGIAVAVGLNMFSSSAVDANRDAVTSDLTHLASKAQQHYKKPTTMGGGNNDFNGFTLGTLDTLNSNGGFRVSPTLVNTKVAAIPAGVITISATDQEIFLIGYGTETGRDGTNLVMAYATITPTGITTTIVN